MKYQKIIPVVTFIIGGCIGIKCGVKYTLHLQKQYLKSDDCKRLMDELIENMFR